jgi:outer membrane immunogenic protein
MKKHLRGTVGLLALGLAAPAVAADLPARTYTKAPPLAAIYDWTGFYIGANGGWGQNRDCRGDVTLGVNFGCHDGDGGVAGGQIGYRWQSAAWVFGLEAQGDWADLRGSNVSLANPLLSTRSKLDAFGLFTGQLGYAWNNALLYVKGGAAVTDNKFDVFSSTTGLVTSSAGSATKWGGTAGAGIEYGFAPNWSAAVEYDHIFQRSRNMTQTTPAGVVLTDTFRAGGDTDLATARLNYRFGGPIVAKY